MYLKSYLLFEISFDNVEKSDFSYIFNSFSLFKISIKSDKFSTEITSIPGINEASLEFEAAKNILLNHFSFAQIVAGSIHQTDLSLPSRDNSHKKILFFTNSSDFIVQELSNIQIAIAKSKIGQVFLISAGAKFTVILDAGNLSQEDFSADLILSLDS